MLTYVKAPALVLYNKKKFNKTLIYPLLLSNSTDHIQIETAAYGSTGGELILLTVKTLITEK